MSARVILLRPGAPAKPVAGQPCNGCGVCCTAQPCPLGQWLSRRRHGECRVLGWDVATQRYRCGQLEDPQRWLRWLRWLPAPLARGLARRWIAAGRGCDSDYEAGLPG
ncbi:MAG: hypothetical protein IPM99_12645 [Rubrivivax sp.]|nr:hypothetical protein [Rubrivivax sp.]